MPMAGIKSSFFMEIRFETYQIVLMIFTHVNKCNIFKICICINYINSFNYVIEIIFCMIHIEFLYLYYNNLKTTLDKSP